jgi:hypothetical protein
MHWFNRAPRVYRFIEQRYVDAFFRTGALRLSSFARFSKHTDEQRLDGKEGTVSIAYQAPGDSGDIVILTGGMGTDAYVLSTCLVPSAEVMQSFGANSAIVINDPRGFALAVAEAVLGFTHGFDGPCSYQSRRFVQRNFFLPEDAPAVPLDETGKLDHTRVGELVYAIAGRDAYFLKHYSYMPQNEWRFLWITSGERHDYLDVVVPAARRFCEPWSNSTNYVAFDKEGPLPPPNT